jgi:LPPG:FO 2-phospho-L-lactate transferase
MNMITCLAGGVGAAKLISGLSKILKPEELTIIVNTGDDMEMHGLHISADIDIIMYTLAGLVDENKGWGIQGDTFYCLDALKKFSDETWFNLGDKDLATHLFRTSLLRKGLKLSEVTSVIGRALGLQVSVLPMTDDKFETRVETEAGTFHFEEYLVKREAKDKVLGVEFQGTKEAKPAPGVIESLSNTDLILVCPSNPIVSIGTILSIEGVRETLRKTKARKIAISPIVGGAPIKGPADKLLRGLGFEVSAFSVAKLYADFLDCFILDEVDFKEQKRIEELGLKVKTTNTIMKSMEDKIRLAKIALSV